MRSPDELNALCIAIRTKEDAPPTEELLAIATEEFDQFCKAVPYEIPQLPPDELVEPLWSFGWLLYELSWSLTPSVQARYEALDDEAARTSVTAAEQIDKLADIARDLPWPEYAPRALGALRSQALAHSKRDTEAGFRRAWMLHEEANELWANYRENHKGDSRYEKALDEVMIQLWLAQTGTSCRTIEQTVGRWAESVRDKEFEPSDEDRLMQQMFDRLWNGVSFGEEALRVAAEIEATYGLAHEVTREDLALVTAFRNPGIMTARAALLLLPLSQAMQSLGRLAPRGYADWPAAREALLQRMRDSYKEIEKPVVDDHGEPVDLVADHQRSVVQIRLNLALVAPNTELASKLDFAECVTRTRLDDAAVQSLSEWLATPQGTRRNNANVIGTATMPSYIIGVEAMRAGYGFPSGYRAWRRQWFELDRYAAEEGRWALVEKALGSAD
jgi:hypothetical protein